MKYQVGMYGGSFDPLHVGHLHDIIRAAAECAELYIIISWCRGRDSVPKELRYRWIVNSCRHLPHVKVLMIEDQAVSKEDYNTGYYWENGARDIKHAIGKPIDAVYCGSDYLGTGRFESLYAPESEIIYFDRSEVPVSSTDIREWAFAHWDYIPAVCRPFYTKKVMVAGGESTGKSTLVQNLALAYNTNFLEEVGREVCERAGCEETMVEEDLEEILLRHKVKELEAVKHSNKVLFVDTDCLVTKFYSQFLLTDQEETGRCLALADAISAVNHYDLVLFLEPDVEFVQDGTRSEAILADRMKYSEQIKEILRQSGIAFECIGGSYLDRFNRAKELIWENIGINTTW